MTGVDQPAAGAIFSTVVHPSRARGSRSPPITTSASSSRWRSGWATICPRAVGRGRARRWRRKVAACLPAFELVEDGDADYKTLDAFTLIAQNTWNGGVVLGAPVTAVARDVEPGSRGHALLDQRRAQRSGQDR